MNSGQNARLGWITHEFGHHFKELRQHTGRRMLVSYGLQIGIERPAEAIEIALVVLQKDGHKVVRIRVGVYLSAKIPPVMLTHCPEALTLRPVRGYVGLFERNAHGLFAAVKN